MDTRLVDELRPAQTRNSLRRWLAGTLASALLVPGTALAAGPAQAAPATPLVQAATVQAANLAMAPSTYEERVRHWVNRKRERRGLPTLRPARCTNDVAERWSLHLAEHDLFYHQSMQDVLERCNARYAGETLGRGAIRPRHLVRLWMHSPGHRTVLLNPTSRRIGIGSTPDAYGRWVTAASFMRF